MSSMNHAENVSLSTSRQYGRRNLTPSSVPTSAFQSFAAAPTPPPNHPVKPADDAVETALRDIPPPFTGPVYTIAQLLSLCPLKPMRSGLPLPASVTELFDQVTVDTVMEHDPLAAAGSSSGEADYELPKPALRAKLSLEDQQLLKVSVLSGSTRRPAIGNAQGQERGGNRFDGPNAALLPQRGIYASTGRARGKGADRQQQSSARYSQRGYQQSAAGEDDPSSPEWIETRRHHHAHPQQHHHDDRRTGGGHAARDSGDLWASPKDMIGRFDENGRFITTVGSPPLSTENAPLERMIEREAKPALQPALAEQAGPKTMEPTLGHAKADAGAVRAPIVKQSRFASLIAQESEATLSAPVAPASLWQSFAGASSDPHPAPKLPLNQMEPMPARAIPCSAFDSSTVPPAQESLPLFLSWTYCDPSGRIQGPFSWEHMRDWTIAGYFTPSLLIKPETSSGFKSVLLAPQMTEAFVPLAKWVERYGDLGFWTPEAKSVKEGLKVRKESDPPAARSAATESASSKSGLMMPTSVIGRAGASPQPGSASSGASTASGLLMDSAILSARIKPAEAPVKEPVASAGLDTAPTPTPRAGWASLPATKSVKSLREIEAELAMQQQEQQARAKAAASVAQDVASLSISGAPWAAAKGSAAIGPSSFSEMLKETTDDESKARGTEPNNTGSLEASAERACDRDRDHDAKSWPKESRGESTPQWPHAAAKAAQAAAAPLPFSLTSASPPSSTSWSSIAAAKNAPSLPQILAPTQGLATQKLQSAPAPAAPMSSAAFSKPPISSCFAEAEPASAPSSELVEWVRGELRRLKLRDLDAPTLVSCIYELSATELIETMEAYIPSPGAANSFVDGFIRARSDGAASTETKHALSAPKKALGIADATSTAAATKATTPADPDDGFSVVVSRKPKKTAATASKPAPGSGTGGRKVVGLA